MVTDSSQVFTIPQTPKPAYLVPTVDPTFGTKVTRIADDAGQPISGLPGGGIWGTDSRHHYSKDQPWNSNNSLILMQNPGSTGGSPTQLILDGETYLPKYGSCGYTLDDSRWHPSLDHAYELIGVREAVDSLVWFNPVTCTLTRGWKLPIKPDLIGMGEGNPSPSLNGRFIAMANNEQIVIVDMDPQPPYASYASGNRRIGPIYTIPACSLSVTAPSNCSVGNVSISPMGGYVDLKFSGVTNDTTQDAHRILSVDPVTLEIRPQIMAEGSLRCGSFQSRPNGWVFPLKHADMTLNPFDNNEEVMIGGRACTGSNIGRVVMVRLRDGAVTPLTDPFKEPSVRHVSTRNFDRPGWAYVSYYPGAGKKFSDEIVAIKLDGSQSVQRFAQMHSLSSGCYRCEPHAVPSRDGSRVIWASNWAQDCSVCGSISEVKDYVVDARSTTPVIVTADRTPVVSAPGGVSGNENAVITVNVTASDPDGQPIGSLTADLSALPPGNNAVFTPSTSKAAGTLTWTPTFNDGASSYPVSFTAANALSGSATTTITVTNVDRPPAVTASTTGSGLENTVITVNVTASDPDGQPITSLIADLSGLPAGNNALFTANAANTAGTLTWTPTFQDGRATPYNIVFRATNALTGTSATALTVLNVDRAPSVSSPSSASGIPGMTITVNVAASDPDGDAIGSISADLSALPVGSDAVFTPNATSTAGTLTWTPLAADIRDTPYSMIFTASNALAGSATTPVIVTADRTPVVSAPGGVSGNENAVITVNVTASDPDGQPIGSLTADLSALPSGSNAVFTPNASKTAGTLTWTPTFTDGASSYAVSFTAANALSGSAGTTLTVTEVDRAPLVTAPVTTSGAENSVIMVNVTAADPDGQPITSLIADLSGLPVGNNAVFTTNAAKTAGTLTWTPTSQDGRTTPFNVVFKAANALSGSSTTAITVTQVDAAPVVTAPSILTRPEGSPISINVTVSDPDGDRITTLTADLSQLPAGNSAVFSPNSQRTSGTLTWTPTFQNARAAPYTVTFTAKNALTGTATTSITVTNVDRAPVVTALSSVKATTGTQLVVNVTALDADGDRITTLTADLSKLPAGHTAVFTADTSGTSGTLRWTPRTTETGNFLVTFTATNALSGSASTTVRSSRPNGSAEGEEFSGSDGGSGATEFALSGASPNPSEGSVTFALRLPAATGARWTVHDIQGRLVSSESFSYRAGLVHWSWNGVLTGGERARPGLYMARLQLDRQVLMRRFILMR